MDAKTLANIENNKLSFKEWIQKKFTPLEIVFQLLV